MADNLLLTADVGESFVLAVTYLQPDGVTPVDMTGATASLIVHDRHNSAKVIGTYPGTINQPTGQISFTLTTEMNAWTFAAAGYRVVLTMNGIPIRLFEGVLAADRGPK